MNYKVYILKNLINKYERSVLSKNGSNRNLSISFKFDSKNMKDYCSEDSYKYIEEIEKSVKFLEDSNYIFVERKKDRIVKVILNIDEVTSVYSYCNLIPRDSIYDMYMNIIEKYDVNDETKEFKQYIDLVLNNYGSTLKYFTDDSELKDIMKVLSGLGKEESISLRNYSAKYLNDSKKLERLEGKFNNVIKDIFKSDISFYEFLESYNIYKNPTYIHMRGKGIFKVNDTIIDLDKFGNELILSSIQIDNLSVIDIKGGIITVENLTTFNDINYKDNLIIYLGGYHDKIKNVLLKKICEYNKSIKFIHIGDIDAGGFYILNHLIEDTGINFDTYKMDVDTLITYKKYCKKLSSNDKERLTNLKSIEILNKYVDVFNYMIDNNVKLEQENIDYFSDN